MESLSFATSDLQEEQEMKKTFSTQTTCQRDGTGLQNF
jgi:hypothetical protein